MDPSAAATAPVESASRFSPTASPLYIPSVTHNSLVLSNLATMAACFSGLVAGILGLTNLAGFFLYILTAVSSAATTAMINCHGGQIARYVPAAYGIANTAAPGGAQGQVKLWKGWLGLTGLGQENLLGFLLFWIGGYALIHVYD